MLLNNDVLETEVIMYSLYNIIATVIFHSLCPPPPCETIKLG